MKKAHDTDGLCPASQVAPSGGGRFTVELVATLPWNARQLCYGISGKFGVESVATFVWNGWQLWRGIRICYAGHEGGLVNAVREGSFHYGPKLCRCYERGFRNEVSTPRTWLLRVSGGSLCSSRGDDFLLVFVRIYDFWRRWDRGILAASFQVASLPE